MKFRIIVYFLLVLLPWIEATPANDECYNCHKDLDGRFLAPAVAFKYDIHRSVGITCSNCHGGDAQNGDMDGAMNKNKGYIGIPQGELRYMICVKCHADKQIMQSYGFTGDTEQFEKLKLSVHFKPSYNNQGPIADCITCHGNHGVLKPQDPQSRVSPANIIQLCGGCHSDPAYMRKYNPGLAVDQVVKYRTSVHGVKNAQGDFNAAQCVSCHGNHDIFAVKDPRSSMYNRNIPKTCSKCHSNSVLMAPYNIPTNQFEKYQKSVHGKALLEKGDASAPACNSCHGNHGAMPPGVESISKVCGTCHAFNMELFEKSIHKSAFESRKLPECESCHGNHGIEPATDELVGTGQKSICITCHKEGEKGFIAAGTMRHLLDTLNAGQKKAQMFLDKAEQLGMDVSDEKYALINMKQILIKARTSIHTSDVNKFKGELNPGFEIVNDAELHGKKSIDNYYFRRQGLAVASVIISLLVVLLFVKLRRIEKEEKPEK